MEGIIREHTSLTEADINWLSLLVDEWSLLADLSFSDLILWVPDTDDSIFWACAQVRPTTGPTSLEEDVVGEEIVYDAEHLVTEAYLSQEISHTSGNKLHAGIPVDVTAVPILDGERCIAVLEAHSNRMGTRAPGALEDTYLEAAAVLAQMVRKRLFPSGGDKPEPWLSPRVGDGLIRVRNNGVVAFASPNALSAYRRLGLAGDLEGENLWEVTLPLLRVKRQPVERPMEALLKAREVREEDLESETATLRIRIIPLVADTGPAGLLVMCRDTTELRYRERQLLTKDATIREIHHRVKNNLQTVAALLRLQARRIDAPEAKDALSDAMKRVAAIAVVHEILSQDFDAALRFDDVADRLLKLVGSVATTRGNVKMTRQGSFGHIPGDVATNLSLVLTELCQNAVEHGLKAGSGEVVVHPQQSDGQLTVTVFNAGESLPDDFSLEASTSLGLSIVSTLVDDMSGTFTLEAGPDGEGTLATVTVPLG
jgi:two-component sensor histidine kinase